jgi:hypothetical protein
LFLSSSRVLRPWLRCECCRFLAPLPPPPTAVSQQSHPDSPQSS